jgi:hypothetical protein
MIIITVSFLPSLLRYWANRSLRESRSSSFSAMGTSRPRRIIFEQSLEIQPGVEDECGLDLFVQVFKEGIGNGLTPTSPVMTISLSSL